MSILYSSWPAQRDASSTIQRLQALLNQQALQGAHQRLAILFEGSPLAIISWNVGGEVVNWNPAAAQLLGCDQSVIGGSVIGFSAARDPLPAHRLAEGQHCQLTRTRSGATRLCQWHNFPQVPEGRLTGVISMIQAVTAEPSQTPPSALQQINQDLEIQVAERTVALQHIIRQSQQEIRDRRQAQQALKQANAELEQRVAQRTIELQQAIATWQAEIAEHRQTEAALTQSEGRFQKLADNIPGMIYQFKLHPEGQFSFPFVSSACRALYQLEPEAVQADAMLLVNMIQAADRPQFEQSIAQSAATQQTWHWSGRMQVGDTVKWIQGISRPESQPDGSTLWDGVLIDISPLKQTELALQMAKTDLESRVEARTAQLQSVITQLQQKNHDHKVAAAALRQSEATNRALLNAMPDLMIRMSGDGTYLDFKPAKTFDCLVDSVTIKGQNISTILPPEAAQQRLHYIDRALQTGEIQVYEYELTIADQVHFEEARIVVSGDQEVLTIVRDISARKQAEQALAQSTLQLKQQTSHLETALKELQRTQSQLVQSEKMSSLGQLVAGIAHEINNPTSFIFGNLNHLTDYTRDLLALITLYQQHYPNPVVDIQATIAAIDLEFLIGDLPKLLASIKFGAQRIQQIVLSLRTFSRIDEADFKSVDLHSGIDSALLILDHRIKQQPSQAPITVIKNYGDLPPIECYAGELNQVFMNILVNAIETLEASQPSAANQPLARSIYIDTELLADQVAIRIRDNGWGITEAVKPHIFDPFFTTKPIGKGTGMGLATSYQIVTARHGGTLTCHSTLGQGAEFTIVIPRCQLQPSASGGQSDTK